jgi:hypothetical protein
MTFTSILDKILETPDEEVARLAAAPDGSKSHWLAGLPVLISAADLKGLVIELPVHHGDRRIVVVPVENRGDSSREAHRAKTGKIRRNGAWWQVIVVASDHPSYPVGGYDLTVPEAELVRGRPLSI